MGRNHKIGLQYFPVDIDILRDKKVRRLTRKYTRGAEFYLYLLCIIYSDKGYYMSIDDETAYDIADDMRITEAEVDEMLDFCMSDNVGLFSREMREKHNILTSRGIQRRYTETIRQLKRKVCINSEYSLINSETDGNSPESLEIYRRSSEEMLESSEEMPESSEEMGINSDKNKREEKKIKEKKEKEISLSLSPSCEVAEEMGGVTPAERENFLKILFFEKKLISPQNELTRFLRHYEKSGWVDANGNKIRSKTAALGAWRPDKDAVKCPDKIAAVWQEVYAAASRASPGTDCTPLLTLFRGIQLDGSSIYILAADKVLMDFIEHPARIEPIGAVIRRHFGANKRLNYRIPRQ